MSSLPVSTLANGIDAAAAFAEFYNKLPSALFAAFWLSRREVRYIEGFEKDLKALRDYVAALSPLEKVVYDINEEDL